jgi:high-affinity Fe2+/Pb2+ permease
VGVPERNGLSGELRAWVAPALGIGLVAAGLAMALGMTSIYAPLLAGAIAAVVLSIGRWRLKRGQDKP